MLEWLIPSIWGRCDAGLSTAVRTVHAAVRNIATVCFIHDWLPRPSPCGMLGRVGCLCVEPVSEDEVGFIPMAAGLGTN
jgi:hypothetical protein